MALKFRKHIRLPDHEYTHGIYFVTLCTLARKQRFGRIIGNVAGAQIELTDTGRIVDECWRAIPDHFPNAQLDEMQIMPDHLHAILILGPGHGNDIDVAGATKWVVATKPIDHICGIANGPRRGSLGAIIGAFKSETTKRVNRMYGTMGQRLWQPNYYERIIRETGGERARISRYIAENPKNWL